MAEHIHTPEPEAVEAPRHWRTLDERDETPAARLAAHDEFVVGAVDPAVPRDTFVSRRDFMGLVAAAAALVGTTACSKRKKGTIVPYTKRPQEVVPGVATYYASAFPEGPRAYPVLVKTREGRPIHVQGNDEHPTLKGKTSPRAVADILRLYDPDRLRAPKTPQGEISWKEAEDRLLKAFSEAKSANRPVLLMTGALPSPTTQGLLADLKRAMPSLEHLAWEPAAGDGATTALAASYGQPVQLRPDLAKAEVVLSLGADLLSGEDPEAIRAFAAKRRLEKSSDAGMNRLWVLEGAMSLTGQNADQRLTVRPSRLAQVAFALARELAPSRTELAGASLPADLHIPGATWKQLVADLRHAGAKALVLCGEAMPFEAHRAAHLLNEILGSQAFELAPAPALATHAQVEATAQKMKAGGYGAVLFWGVNPVYAHPKPDLWQEALARMPFKAWLGLMEDETSARCALVLPESHWLESWGDFETRGAQVLQQPTIAPLYDSRQGEDILLALIRGLGGSAPAEVHLAVQARWQREVQPKGSLASFERFWQSALHDGLVAVGPTPLKPAFRAEGLREAVAKASAGAPAGFELQLTPSTQVLDGRYGNNGWLQELPDPVTKTAWGNPLVIGVGDAKALALKDGDQVKLSVGGKELLLPVIVQPGQAKGVFSLALGYGRATGGVARAIGTNAFPLLGVDACPNLRSGVTLTPTGRRVEVPRTQAHHRMEGRDLVRSWSLAEFAHHEAHPHKPHVLHTLYPDVQFPGERWGMVIDLSACVGCSGCVVACGSENNVPVVGPEQVAKGREMHWIRIDRYYEGDAENPKAVHQPMLCQHCEHAPCENVCPVNATNQSPDGLNQMAYNRCVGTRYCANNCPYKVRRFNFHEYTAYKSEPETLVYNPEVTVRPRGVMEKCTFCVQRINDGRIRAKGENRPLRDGEIAPACAVACPGEAIVFGDLKDPNSRVSQLIKSGRQYKVLEDLGARPAVTYLANLRNPGGEEAHHG